jgi:mannose-6-phosphate isomerase-like protein (cupin superfamily)
MPSQTDVPHPPVNVRLRGQDTDSHLALVEFVVGADESGPPLHVHPKHAEGFYILEGELRVQVSDEVVTAGPGTFFYAPPDTPHTFANFSGRDARMLVICTPAGFEAYFDQLAAGVAATPPADQAIAVGPPINH